MGNRFIPFILMTLIVAILLVMFGLDPTTGQLKRKSADDHNPNMCGDYGYNDGCEDFFNVNLISQVILCRQIISHFKGNGSGDIIIMGSEAALAGKRKATLYSAAKFGLRGFAQALRDEVAASGVRVCMINPGLVRSSFFDSLDFEPGNLTNNAIEPDYIAKIVSELLKTLNGTIIDEINLSPVSNSINFK